MALPSHLLPGTKARAAILEELAQSIQIWMELKKSEGGDHRQEATRPGPLITTQTALTSQGKVRNGIPLSSGLPGGV